MKVIQYYISAIVILLMCSQDCISQIRFDLHYDKYLTHRSGHILGAGLSGDISATTIGIGITYNDFGSFNHSADLAVDSGTNSDGLGIKIIAHKFFSKKKSNSGLFYGLRSDLQFLENEHWNYLAFQSSPRITSNKVFLTLGELGYLIPLSNKIKIQLKFSGGYSSHPSAHRPILFMSTINASYVLTSTSQ